MKWLIYAACAAFVAVPLACRSPKVAQKQPRACFVVVDVIDGSENRASLNNIRWNTVQYKLPVVVRVRDGSDIRSEGVFRIMEDPQAGIKVVVAGRPVEMLDLAGQGFEKYFVIYRDGMEVDRPADVVYCKLFAPSEFYPSEYFIQDAAIREIIKKYPPIVVPQD